LDYKRCRFTPTAALINMARLVAFGKHLGETVSAAQQGKGTEAVCHSGWQMNGGLMSNSDRRKREER
jgi:hypothetical protein